MFGHDYDLPKGTAYLETGDYNTLSAMLQLLFSLCSDEPDMPKIERPKLRRTSPGRVHVPDEPRVWDVGVRISNAIRRFRQVEAEAGGGKDRADETDGKGHASPRPHARSAHWHTFWTGPRDATYPERKPIIRWLPPMPIGVDWRNELPTIVKRVE